MIKKFVLILYIITFLINPALAEWVDIGNNMYLDSTHISKYNKIYGQNHIHSIWVKIYNITELEKVIGKKAEYAIGMYLINCKTKEFAAKSVVFYENKSKVADSHTYGDYELNWMPIYPDSNAEYWQFFACFGEYK